MPFFLAHLQVRGARSVGAAVEVEAEAAAAIAGHPATAATLFALLGRCGAGGGLAVREFSGSTRSGAATRRPLVSECVLSLPGDDRAETAETGGTAETGSAGKRAATVTGRGPVAERIAEGHDERCRACTGQF